MQASEIPTIKRFARGDRLHVQAQQLWMILVAIVMCSDRDLKKSVTITYGDLALLMGYLDRRAGHMLGRQLGIVGRYCEMNDLPALNCIVVSQDTGMPGAEVVLTKGRSVGAEQRAVMREDWFSLRVPSTGTFRKVWEAM